MKEILEKYLKTLKSKFQTGKTTEVSFYSVLEELFKELLQFSRIKGNVICNPQKTEIGFPDFIVNGEHGSKIGYIEAKDLFADLNEISKTEQLKRYIESLPNLILTNYLEFCLYRDHKKIKTVKIIEESEFENKARFTIGDLTEIQAFFDSFFSFSIKNIYKAKELATELAKRTRLLKINTKEILDVESEEEKGLLYGTFKAFKEHLISDLKIDEFSDMYAQTITYGLFLAKLNSEGEFDRTLAHRYIPESISLLYDMFRNLAEEDLPKALMWNVEDITNVLNNADISNIRKEIYYHTQTQDPIIHFYETFLAQYDAKLRKQRGVYYTPEPVVSFIVRSINTLLKEKFDKPLGLADSDVKILDPACGTATFLASVIETVHQEIILAGRKGLLRDIIKNHVLEDVYGFELMMAPYAVAHLKLSLLLRELGYEMAEEERFKIYLTNTLESKKAHIIYLPFYESLTKESAEAQKVKEETPILVVLANPPYSVSSFNKSEFIETLMEDYKKDVKGERNIQPLSDDYIKFIRFAQWKIEQGGRGIFAYISNNSYLSGLIHRGMRKSLLDCFDEIYILNLHGNSRIGETCPDGSKDENVFDIQQGVAIGIFVKTSPQPSPNEGEGATRPSPSQGEGKDEIKRNLFYADLWGLRENKNNDLLQNDIRTIKWEKLIPKSPQYFFVPKDFALQYKYERFQKITDIFKEWSFGVTTSRDNFVVGFTKEEVVRRIRIFTGDSPNEVIKKELSLEDTGTWKLSEVREKVKGQRIEEKISPYAHRPFDNRWICYESSLIERDRRDIMRHVLTRKNLGLNLTRRLRDPIWRHVYVTLFVTDKSLVSSRDNSYFFPLYLYSDKSDSKLLEGKPPERTPNLNPDFVRDLTLALSLKEVGRDAPTISPEQIFFYCYGIMHSETYRKDYEEFLKIDFPRIPFTKDYNLFLEISKIGEEIGRLHLLESPLLGNPVADYPIEGEHLVKKPVYEKKTGRLYINDEQYFGNVPQEVWEFVIGGYQVLDKYLKYRKNRKLSREEIEHLLKVITAIKFTIDKMKIADELFKKIDLNNLVMFEAK
jgi:predicted helicase